MRLYRIFALLKKETLDGTRTFSLYVALAVGIGLGLFARAEDPRTVTIVHTAEERQPLVSQLRHLSDARVIEVNLIQEPTSAEARRLVKEGEADLALVSTARDTEDGNQSTVALIYREVETAQDLRVQAVASALELAFHRVAMEPDAPAIIRDVIPTESTPVRELLQEVQPGEFQAIFGLIAFVVFVGLWTITSTVSEETVRKTLDAVSLVAKQGELIVSKAVFGLGVIVIGLGLAFLSSGLRPEDPPLFVAAFLLLAVCMVGMGLLAGSVTQSQRDENAWGMLIGLPLLAAPALVVTQFGQQVEYVARYLPTTHAASMAVNGLTGNQVLQGGGHSLLVIGLWTAAAYGLLFLRLSRRES